MVRSLSVCSLLLAVVGCSQIDSEDLETSGMVAGMDVIRLNDGSGSDVHVSLAAGTLNFVDLSQGDELVASFGDESVVLTQGEFLGLISYNGKLTSAKAAGDEVKVSLNRADKTPAPDSIVALPAQVDITAPAASSSFSRAEAITVTFSSEQSENGATLSWFGDCIKDGSLDVPAGQTTATINANTIEKKEQVDENDPDSEPVPDTCKLTVRVRREVQGTLDPNYKSGSIKGVSQSNVDLTTTP